MFKSIVFKHLYKAEQIEATFHLELSWVKGLNLKVCFGNPGQMTIIAARPVYMQGCTTYPSFTSQFFRSLEIIIPPAFMQTGLYFCMFVRLYFRYVEFAFKFLKLCISQQLLIRKLSY